MHLLATLAFLALQAPVFETHPDDPLHRQVVLECDAQGRAIGWVADFEGVLHVWAASRAVRPLLTARAGEQEAVGDDLLAGRATWLRLDVAPEARIELHLAATEGSGPIELHLVAAPSTAATRAAAEASRETRSRLEAQAASGEAEAARRGVLEWTAELERLEGGDACELAHGARERAAIFAFRLGEYAAARSGWERCLAHDERVLPPHHQRALEMRQNLGVALRNQGDLAAARAWNERLVRDALEHAPGEVELILNVQRNLAVAAQQQGDLETALALNEGIVARRIELHGIEHPETCEARGNLAGTLFLLDRTPEAHRIFSELEAHYAATLAEDHPDLLRVRINLASTSAKSGFLRRAIELREGVLAVRSRRLPAGHPELLNAQLALARSYKDFGDLARAREGAEQVLEWRDRALAPDHADRLVAVDALASVLGELGDTTGELDLRREIAARLEQQGRPVDRRLLGARFNLAGALRRAGEAEQASSMLRDQIDFLSSVLDDAHPLRLSAEAELARCMKDLGDLSGALEIYRSILERSADDPRREPGLRLAWRAEFAFLLGRLGRVEEGIGELELALEDADGLSARHEELLVARQNLALLRILVGDYLVGHRILEELHVLQQERHSDEHRELVSLRKSLATIRLQLGDLRGAQDLAEALVAARVRLGGEEDLETQEARSTLASILHARGDSDRSVELLESVLAIQSARLPADHPRRVETQAILAQWLTHTDPERALELAEQAHGVLARRLPPTDSVRMITAVTLARLHRRTGDLDRARDILQDLRAALAATRRWDKRAGILTNLAAVLELQEDLDGLLAVSRELLELQVEFAEGLALEAPRLARSAAQEPLQDLSRWFHWARRAGLGPQDAPRRELDELLFRTLESLRAVSTTSSALARAAARRPELSELRESLARTRSRLHDLGASIPSEEAALASWRSDLQRLNDERDRQERELRALVLGGETRGTVPDVATLAASLAPDELLANFFRYARVTGRKSEGGNFRGEDSYLAFVVTPDADLRVVELGSAEDLERELEAWRGSLGLGVQARGLGLAADGDAELLGALGAALSRRLLDPVLGDADGVRVLHVVLDDALHALPLEALPSDGGLVGDRLALRRHANVLGVVRRSAVTSDAAPSPEPRLLALGGVDYGVADVESNPDVPPAATTRAAAPFVPLPGSAGEVEAVGRAFEERFARPAHLLQGTAATKQRFFELASGATHVHVATHGWFAPQMLEGGAGAPRPDAEDWVVDSIRTYLPDALCGLALAGANRPADATGRVPGLVTAVELAALDLAACELVVLSACETHLGLRTAGQGIHSLQNAVLDAGARTAITSLWKVDDDATRELFEAFYRALWLEGHGPAEALRQAQAALRSAGRPVRDWAAWVLTGAAD